MAHRKKKRDMQRPRPGKRVKLDGKASDWEERARSEESEVEYDEEMHSYRYYDANYSMCYLENEAEDSDGEKWGYDW